MANSCPVRPKYDPGNSYGTYFGSSSLLVSKVANRDSNEPTRKMFSFMLFF